MRENLWGKELWGKGGRGPADRRELGKSLFQTGKEARKKRRTVQKGIYREKANQVRETEGHEYDQSRGVRLQKKTMAAAGPKS